MHPSTPSLDPPSPRRRPLPVTIMPGMPVVEIEGGIPATVVGITQAYCVYRLAETDALAVANWRDVAVGSICPAEPLLPSSTSQCDRDNARATVLRELLRLQQFGLTAAQQATLDELVAQLCAVPAAN